ncbi:MAG: Mfa1 family fimbria major subunit [Bacteroides sp.]|nr:Mfa1 family fimbria major subunit [Bacteroides sp.]
MKKTFKYAWLMVAALAVGLWSCSKSDDTPDKRGDVTEGKAATVQLRLAFPQTYAADVNAKDTENEVKKVYLYILNADNGAIVTYQEFDVADLTPNGNNNYTSSSIRTTSGNRKIFAGVNLPIAMRNNISQNGLSAIDETTVYDLGLGELNDTTGIGFSMFSTQVLEKTLLSDEDSPTGNSITIEVERMVGKVSVVADLGTVGTCTDGSGTLEDLAFDLGIINKKTYVLQYMDGGIIKDPNYAGYAHSGGIFAPGSYDETDFYDFTGSYLDVDDISETDNSVLNAKYAPENTADLALQGSNTYISLKGYFVPTQFSDDQGDPKSVTYTKGEGFWTVDDATNGLKFFDDRDEAADYAENILGIPATDVDDVIVEYADGICYYNLYVSKANGYNFLRNNYYKATVTAVNSLGNPDPGPEDPDQPVDGDLATIEVEIDIVPWNLILEDHEAGK